MAQIGIHIAFAYQTRKIISQNKYSIPAVIFGSIIPDIDIILVLISSIFKPDIQHLFFRTFSHSFFTIILIYFIFSFIYEWKKDLKYKLIGNGLILGILSHIILDTFLWFEEIQFLWPLPLAPFNFWSFWNAPDWVHRFLMTTEFFFFYCFFWFLITKHLNNPNKLSWIIKYLQYWRSFEIFLLVIISLCAYINPMSFIIIFRFAYIPSLIIALWATYMSRKALIN